MQESSAVPCGQANDRAVLAPWALWAPGRPSGRPRQDGRAVRSTRATLPTTAPGGHHLGRPPLVAASTYWKLCNHVLGSVPEQPINNSFQKCISLFTVSPLLHTSPSDKSSRGNQQHRCSRILWSGMPKRHMSTGCRHAVNTAS